MTTIHLPAGLLTTARQRRARGVQHHIAEALADVHALRARWPDHDLRLAHLYELVHPHERHRRDIWHRVHEGEPPR